MNLAKSILVHRMLESTVLGGTVLEQFIEYVDNLVWGPWMLALLLGTGCYLTLRLDLLPLKNLKFALRCAFGLEEETEKAGEFRRAGRRNAFAGGTAGGGF